MKPVPQFVPAPPIRGGPSAPVQQSNAAAAASQKLTTNDALSYLREVRGMGLGAARQARSRVGRRRRGRVQTCGPAPAARAPGRPGPRPGPVLLQIQGPWGAVRCSARGGPQGLVWQRAQQHVDESRAAGGHRGRPAGQGGSSGLPAARPRGRAGLRSRPLPCLQPPRPPRQPARQCPSAPCGSRSACSRGRCVGSSRRQRKSALAACRPVRPSGPGARIPPIRAPARRARRSAPRHALAQAVIRPCCSRSRKVPELDTAGPRRSRTASRTASRSTTPSWTS